jgi:uncharacterized protein (DUF2147 family)
MKKIWVIILCMTSFLAKAAGPDDILGVWFTENNEAKILVYKSGNEYSGKIIWLKEPLDKYGKPKRDINNPDPLRRNDPAIGIIVFKKMKYENNSWKGTAYGPKRGKEAGCTLKLKDKDTLVGTVKYGFFSGSQTWKRAE